MKSPRIVLLLVGLLLAACQASLPGFHPPPTATAAPVENWDDRSLFEAGLVGSARPILQELAGASVYHLDLDIEDDLATVSGTEEVQYTNTEDVALTEVRFRLFPNILGGVMQVSEIQIDGMSAEPRFELAESAMIVRLPSALAPGASVILNMDFSVEVPQSLELNYGVLAYADGVLALAHAYPMIEVYDDEGWNAEIPPQAGDVTFADMSFFVVNVTAPSDLILVATGREIERSERGGRQMVSYASGPARDFYLAASPDYQLYSKQVGEVLIRFYASSEREQGALEGLETAAAALEIYDQRYAPYPYSELDLVSTPTLALGIEYPGMIAITDRIINPGEPYLEGTIAHEVAHQWFYNLVGNDQLDDPWLDESLAQFATLQYFSDRYGPGGEAGFRASLTGRWARVDDAPIPIGMPVAAYSDMEYGAIVYGRGPLFFVTLREEIGADAFDAFMKDYAGTYSWEIATPDGLLEMAQRDCDCDLTPLFEEWVYP